MDSQSQSPPADILFVSHVANLGGAERSLLDLVHALDRRRFAPRVAVPGDGELTTALAGAGVPVDACPALQRLRRSFDARVVLAQLASLRRGREQLRRTATAALPALVHANSTTAALYAQHLGGVERPLVWHARDLADHAWLGRVLARACARIVVPSEACRAQVAAWADPAKLALVPNGIATGASGDGGEGGSGAAASASLRAELAPNAGILAVVVGQLAPWKGHELAVDAARRVVDANPDVRFALVGADRFGDDPQAGERLVRKIAQLGLSKSVRWLGHRDDVDRILGCADVLVHPAFPEPFGRVVIEAMEAAVPVVAFAGPHGPAELVRHGTDGLLVSPRSAEALADATLWLAARPAERARMGAAGRGRVRASYDRSLMATRIEAVYAELLAGLGSRAPRPLPEHERERAP